MLTISISKFRANMTAYVDEALHHGKTTIITRRGKPVAIVAPPGMVKRKRRKRVLISKEEWQATIDAIVSTANPNMSGVDDLRASRRRMTDDEVDAFFVEIAKHDKPTGSAVEDLLASRR